MIKLNPFLYLYSSIFLAIIPIIIPYINLNKYKVFYPTPEMKREHFVKESYTISNFSNYKCFPKDNNCYEIVNNSKFNINNNKQCTLDDWKSVESDNCNIYNFIEKLLIIFPLIINIAKFCSCRAHNVEINTLQDIKKINYISILINFLVIYQIIINLFIFYNGYNNIYYTAIILEIIFTPTIFYVFELNKNIKCCKKYKCKYTIKIVPSNNIDISNLCLVCYNNRINILFTPCNHLCCCNDCAELSLINCPYCRTTIENKINIFIP